MAIALLLPFAIAAQAPAPPPTFARDPLRLVDSVAAAEFARDSLGSLTIGVVSGRSLVWSKSYGYSDSARTRLATPATVYRIASITKQLTAVMLLQLVERGQVRLSDPVDRYFPDVRRIRAPTEFAGPPTLVQLATMTSGLPRAPNDQRKSQSGLPSQWLQVLSSALPSTEYVRPPGSGYGYSNVGYAILAAALAGAAQESYISYQRRRIINPLGMTSTDFELDSSLGARLATGVDYDELYRDTLNFGDAALDHRNGLGYALASGGAYSTVEDLAKLISLQLGFGPDSVLRSETLKLRDNVPVAANGALDYGYGLGYQAMRWGDTVVAGHSGNLAGYSSMVLYDRQRGFGVIVLRSAAGGKADAGRLAVLAHRRLRAALTAARPTP